MPPKKDSKNVKGGKGAVSRQEILGRYATTSKTESSSAKKGYSSVHISDEIEELILKLLDSDTPSSKSEEISTRRTFTKINRIYEQLLQLQFRPSHIEDALTKTLAKDFNTVLDWLCLHVPHKELPPQFAGKRKEAEKNVPLEIIPADDRWEDPKQNVSRTTNIKPAVELTKKPSTGKEKPKNQEKKLSQWILSYASTDEPEEPPETEELNIDFLKEELEEAKKKAAEAKQGSDSEYKKQCHARIKELLAQIQELEKQPANKKKSRKEKVQKEPTEPKTDNSENFPDSLDSLFQPSEEESASTSEPNRKERKRVTFISATKEQPLIPLTWTAKTPKTMLMEWAQRNHRAKPKFDQIGTSGNSFAFSVTVVDDKKKEVTVSLDEYTFSNAQNAQHAVSTLALYRMCPNQPLYQLMPPFFRDLWLGWVQEEKKKKEEATVEESKDRNTFINQLLQQLESKRTSTKETKEDSPQSTKDSYESWEDISVTASTPKKKDTSKRDQLLEQEWRKKEQNEDYQKMLEFRKKLPAYGLKDLIVNTVNNNQVTVICGETGCGKSTQVPQFLLEDMISRKKGSTCRIVCTQPRRISAMSLAERVANERVEPLGNTVGYHIRLESSARNTTSLLFCTTGILLRRFQGSRTLEGVTHVILDEVHERNLQSDFLLGILKSILPQRPDMKVVLMSATLNAELFSRYFDGCPIVNIPGRMFPVQQFYLEDVLESTKHVIAEDSPYARPPDQQAQGGTLTVTGARGTSQTVVWDEWDENPYSQSAADESVYSSGKYSQSTIRSLERVAEERINYDLIEDTIAYIDDNLKAGAILVFLPGLMEIQQLYDQLTLGRRFGNKSKYRVLPLHSTLSSQDQMRVFEQPPSGCRKIVLATNIAETSITIDDVVYVIDSGKVKEFQYDKVKRMKCLVETWISRANSKQRSGRAGRVSEGYCFRLYTRAREKKMSEFQLPEMHRVPLEELCLQIKLLNLGNVAQFFERCIEPPSAQAIQSAITTLLEVKAIQENEALTSLGYHLAVLPVDVRIGKMMVFGAIFRCLDSVLTIAASMSFKSPFISPFTKRDEADAAKRTFATGNSDLLTLLTAYNAWEMVRKDGRAAESNFCSKNYMSLNTLKMLRELKGQFLSQLQSIGFVAPEEQWRENPEKFDPNVNCNNLKLVTSVICAGLYPNIIRVEKTGHTNKFFTEKEEVYVHPVSINHKVHNFPSCWLAYHEKVKTNRVFVRDSTMISAYPILLFGGNPTVQHQQGTITVDNWIILNAPAKTAVLFRELQAQLEKILHIKITQPSVQLPVIDAIIKLISSEE